MPNTLFNRMSLILTHMHTLRNRKADLDGEIASEQKRRVPDHQQLHWLKVRRLMVRDQIQRYEVILVKLKETLMSGGAGKAEIA